jgi:hypothetical protein
MRIDITDFFYSGFNMVQRAILTIVGRTVDFGAT